MQKNKDDGDHLVVALEQIFRRNARHLRGIERQEILNEAAVRALEGESDTPRAALWAAGRAEQRRRTVEQERTRYFKPGFEKLLSVTSFEEEFLEADFSDKVVTTMCDVLFEALRDDEMSTREQDLVKIRLNEAGFKLPAPAFSEMSDAALKRAKTRAWTKYRLLCDQIVSMRRHRAREADRALYTHILGILWSGKRPVLKTPAEN